MRRVLVVVAAVLALGGCGYASEVESPPSTTIGASVEDGSGLEDAQAEEGQRLQEEWERQMAEDARDAADDWAGQDPAECAGDC
jgi:hypothetical protein